MTLDNEKLYKERFQPAAWIPKDAADCALESYRSLYRKLTEEQRKGVFNEFREISYKAIEIFCTDPELKEIWDNRIKFDPDCDMMIGIFRGYFIGYSLQPSITINERDKRLKKIDQHLEGILELIKSDNSVDVYVELGLLRLMGDIFQKFNHLNYGQPADNSIAGLYHPAIACNPQFFFEALKTKISEVDLLTHMNSPRKTGDETMRERTYFIRSFDLFIDYSYGYRRSNHALTARLLNKIRPDLGEFTPDNIRLSTQNLDRFTLKPKSKK
jgi:hypothetical protein